MSWAGKVTFAVVAIGGMVWHDVRTLQLNAPQRRGVVDIETALNPAVTSLETADLLSTVVLPIETLSLGAVVTVPLTPLDEIDLPRLLHAPPVFVDNFERLDDARLWAVSDGWSNGAWTANDWRRRQLQTGEDGLSITLAPNREGAEQPYASGEIATRESFRYGYFEARLRMPRGSGLVGGVFTFARPEGRESWYEIDLELLGRDTRRLELTYFTAGRETKHVIQLPFDAADDFHTYAFDWQPTYIRWYVDGQLVHESRGADVEALNRDQRFIVNLWNSEQLAPWVGPIDANGGPWTMALSCVAHADGYTGAPICDQPNSPTYLSEGAASIVGS
jgi:endo-1,3-1,4-beta-glycanase ExoK